jgi:hypothetical protein
MISILENITSKKNLEQINMTATQRKQQFKEIEEGFSADYGFPEPFKVAEAIFDALFSEKPKPRYLVCANEEEVKWVMMLICLLVLLDKARYSRA